MKLSLIFCLFLVLKKTNQQCFPSNSNQQPVKTTRLSLYSGQQGFSLALLQALNQLSPNENLFFSPYSTYHALIIAYFLAGNQTENYLKKVLKFDESKDKTSIYQAYKLDKFTLQLRGRNTSYEFNSANKIYVAEDVPVRECVKNHFPDELEAVNFKTNPENARIHINGWVETITHNMIQDLLPPGSIDEASKLVLVNAAYFKGVWENKFNPTLTTQEVFYVNPSKQIMVDMMHVEGTFNHDVSESLGAHILEMPYQGDQVSMYILLPPFAKDDAIDSTLKKLTLEKFKALVEANSLISRTVQVSLPKFTLEHTIELVPILESLGVGNLFKNDADFSTLTNQKVSVGEGIHKARIVVNEKGSEAAAATVLFTFRMMVDEQDDSVAFKCNKPFIFFIYDKETHSILFSGIFRHP